MGPKRFDPNRIRTREELLEFRARTEGQYLKSCHHIWSVILFTVINIFLLVTNSNTYFLFSAAIPRMLIDFGMFFCGKYPAEYYGGDKSMYDFFGNGLFILTIVGALLILGLYLLCWFLAKKRKVAWLIVALVLFVVDCVLFFYWYGFSSDMLIDLVFRGWIVLSFIMGIEAHFILKKTPSELPTTTSYTTLDLTPSEADAVTEEAAVTEEETDTEVPKETTDSNE